MKHDFDAVVDRMNTSSVKWDEVENLFGDKDILPMWVADMDFKAPEAVSQAIKEKAEHGVFGYTTRSESYFESIISWFNNRHQWKIEKEWICHSPGVVTALSLLVHALTSVGDSVVIQPPVYYPFTSTIKKQDRKPVYNPLKFDGNTYSMNFDELEKIFQSQTIKLFILCSPHNPVGRVWKEDELKKLGELCVKHKVILVADEIHGDLILEGHKHIPFASLSEEFREISVTCTAPSKTFNLASLQTSNIIIPNQELREKYLKSQEMFALGLPNVFGMVAAESAYRYGEDWLDDMLDYLQGNLNFMKKYLKENIPEIKVN